MRRSPILTLACWIVVALAATAAIPANLQAQVFVYPRRAGQTNVRYDDFNWFHLNILAGPDADVETTDPGPRGGADPVNFRAKQPDSSMMPTYPLVHPASNSSFHRLPGANGVDGDSLPRSRQERIDELAREAGGAKLYFYESEREVAKRAVPTIEDSYRDLIDTFDFAPPKTFPFILYNSYQEFLQTNLFPIQEGVLGVTSPRNLKLTLPYFGDHRQFRRVSHHELVHQFTIQKVRSVASANDAFRNPIEAIPLWYIEGLAEYYTHDGLDDETKMLVRDLAVHQAPRRGYVMGSFFQRGPRSFLWIYKFGQARCAFLEETYGNGTLQTILDQSYKLGQGRWEDNRLNSFQALVKEVTGDAPKKIEARFENWVKDRAYDSYLDASQKHGEFTQLDKINRQIRGFDASDDGNLLAYKTIDRNTGRNRIFLADRRDLSSETQLVVDGHPGLNSLHPLEGDNFDLQDSEVTFIGRWKGRDVLFRQEYSVETKRLDAQKAKEAGKDVRTRISTGERTRYPLEKYDILAAESPALSPSDDRIAFIGLDDDGRKDIFVLTSKSEGDTELTRITDDIFAERGLAWGDEGLVYTSHETGHGRYNVFRRPPEPGAESTRLTSAPTDHIDPVVLPDGTVMFTAYNEARANLYVVTDSGAVRRTDITTGLFSPAPGPNGGAWALFHHAGRRVPVELSKETLNEFSELAYAPDVPGGDFESRSLEDASRYQPLAPRNWELNNAFGVLGVSTSGVFGQVFASASDRLRNHQLLLEALAFGSFARTDGALTYINQENRIVWGASLFQDFRYRIDQTFPEVGPENFLTFERFYGGRGLLRYPFNQYTYLQLATAIGGTTYFMSEGAREQLNDATPADADESLGSQWDQRNDSPRFQTEGQLSFGFDNLHYDSRTGPISGSALLASVTGDYQPGHDTAFGNVRLDGETYLPLYDRINVFFRMGAGDSFGHRLARQFFLSSFHTLRGVPFGDTDYLLGETFLFSTLELQFPLNFLVRVPFVDLEGVVGADFGGVSDDYAGVWDKRVFDAALGVNFGFGPLVFRLHFAKPFDISPLPVPNNGDWVPNLSLGYRYR